MSRRPFCGLSNLSGNRTRPQFHSIFSRAVLLVLTDTNPKSFEVGELFLMESLETGQSKLVLAVLDFWAHVYGVSIEC